MASKIILYDLPSQKPCTCWSLNPWKVRLSLNYKGIPYETQWTEYPDIAPKFKALGIPPSTGPGEAYTIPTATCPSGEHIMDSINIVRALEKLQPRPPLHVDDPIVARTQNAVSDVWAALAPLYVPSGALKLLNPYSAEYMERTRSKRFGMPLAEVEKSEKAQNAWVNAQPKLEVLKGLLAEKEGTFVLGEEPSYADFIIVGLFKMFNRVGEEPFQKLVGFDSRFEKLYEACGEWLKKED